MLKVRRHIQILILASSLSLSLFATAPALAAPPANSCANAVVEDFNPFEYYYSKLLELKDIDDSAPYAVALRALIHMRAGQTRYVYVALKDLKPIHEITHEESLDKLNERIEAAKVLVSKKKISNKRLSEVIPSKNSIRVIRSGRGPYVVFDGNGRLAALEQALPPTTQIEVEYFPIKSSLFSKVLRRLREMRGVLD